MSQTACSKSVTAQIRHNGFASDNPDDIASRGITAKQLSENELWFKGPDFLWKNHVSVVNHDLAPDLNPEDPQEKKCKVTALIANHEVTKWKEEKLFPKVLEL